MDPRTVAHVLAQIADLLELRGENPFKSRAYRTAARAVLGVTGDDLRPTYRSGELGRLPGIGVSIRGIIGELLETGESSYLEQLRGSTPEGLIDMLRVPGIGTARIHAIYEGLGIATVAELEHAARSGRLAQLKGFGPKTVQRILAGITQFQTTGSYVLLPHAAAEAERFLAVVRGHPQVVCAAVAGSVRRRNGLVRGIDIVVACTAPPTEVAATFARLPAVRDVTGEGGPSVSLRFVDGTLLDLHCVDPEHWAVALWRATGSAAHIGVVAAWAVERGYVITGDELRTKHGATVELADESALYAELGLPYIEPELREGCGEVEAAAQRALPSLLSLDDIRGVLHCHSRYSDGKATIAEMATAAKTRGWSYLGISDHSQSASYAGGLPPERVLAQHDEIERVNATMGGVRVLKGIEADILPDGRIDYEPDFLDRFDYVIGSVHSRFAMDQATMTERVLRALDDPHLTILGHPTGRLLLKREPYAIDIRAVLEKAAAVEVAVELNADPHRLDLDWGHCRTARQLGVAIAIGPDAHSTHGLDNMEIGVGIARKGWLEASDVLNTRSAEEVVERARARRWGAAGKRTNSRSRTL